MKKNTIVLHAASGLLACAFAGLAAAAPQVEVFTPRGEAKGVRQVAVRFTEPMVAFGDPRLADPFALRYAPIVHAASGYELAYLRYQDHPERPLKSAMFTADYLTGVHAFGAICAALVRRARTAQGEFIDCAMMDAMLGMLAYECAAAQFPVRRPRPIFRATRALDGFLILAPISPANFDDLAQAAGYPEWLSDPRFITSEMRAGNWESLMNKLDAWASDKTAAECEAIMSRGGVPCSRYYTVGEAMALPYAAERGLLATVKDAAGEFKVTNPPFRMRTAAAAAGGFVAALGEHNEQVLRECLGRSRDAIEKLAGEGVLCGKRPEPGGDP